MAEKQRILQRIYGVSEKCLLAPKTPFTLDNPELLRQTAISCVSFRFQHIENENMDCLLWRLCLFFIPKKNQSRRQEARNFSLSEEKFFDQALILLESIPRQMPNCINFSHRSFFFLINTSISLGNILHCYLRQA